jgi:hypothetical protein
MCTVIVKPARCRFGIVRYLQNGVISETHSSSFLNLLSSRFVFISSVSSSPSSPSRPRSPQPHLRPPLLYSLTSLRVRITSGSTLYSSPNLRLHFDLVRTSSRNITTLSKQTCTCTSPGKLLLRTFVLYRMECTVLYCAL